MRVWSRWIGLVLLAAFVASPLGVAAEGYVCASGMRMVHNGTLATAACAHCLPATGSRGAGRASLERPCCLYVGSTTLPPVVSTASASSEARPQATSPILLPGVTAVAAFARDAVPTHESEGSGVPPPSPAFRSPILRN